jgi:competence protein ComEA
VRDAIDAASGAHRDADLSGINLAALLQDGDFVRVPFKQPTQAPSAAVPSDGTEPPTWNETPTPAAPGLINNNTATLAELDTLSSIGPIKAQSIIDYQETNGPFAGIEDILVVTGIGLMTFNDIKDLITVGISP